MGLLTAPFRGLLRVFEEIADRADKELYNEDAVMAELTQIYSMLEAGSLSAEEFEQREADLVERLEEIENHNNNNNNGGSNGGSNGDG